jgi:outer membrane protein OmpA-like peptidoglycan-associated protein
LYPLIAIFLIACAVWFFTRSSNESIKNIPVTVDGTQRAADKAGFSTVIEKKKIIGVKSSVKSSAAETPLPKTTSQKMQSPLVARAKSDTRVAASFSAGSSQPASLSVSLPALLREKLKSNAGLTINVLGYASSEGSLEINQQISQARADACKRLLIQEGIAEACIDAIGKGIENPIASNENEAGRRKNRRVEISW